MPPNPETQKAPARGLSGNASTLVKAQVHRNSAEVQTSTPPSIDLVRGRLERVRKVGDGYIASCPAHEDRNASLSIAIGNDGRILVHCFAGCAIGDVLGAIGLMISDLFPQRIKDASPEARKELQGLALKSRLQACANVLDHESGVVLIAAGDVHKGRMLTDADHNRLALACERIRAAKVAIGGRQ